MLGLDQLSPDDLGARMLNQTQKRKTHRAPMVNPYDKFTQLEFDAWIGGITGSLRDALGYEQERPSLPGKVIVNDGAVNDPSLDYSSPSVDDHDEESDSSLPHITKIRRDKGKARDPREGPGLGGDRSRQIELLSSDEEDEGEVEALTLSFRVKPAYEDVESDYLSESSSRSSRMLSSPLTRLEHSNTRHVLESDAEHDDSGDDEYLDNNGDHFKLGNGPSEVITLISDEDEIDEEYEDSSELEYQDPGSSLFRYPRGGDKESQEDNGGVENDDEFPPRSSPPHHDLELNDPWEAILKYAEDLYTGGDTTLPAGAKVDPDHLGPFDEKFIEGAEEGHLLQTGATSELSQNYDLGDRIVDSQLRRKFSTNRGDDDSGDIISFSSGVGFNGSEFHIYPDQDERSQPLAHSIPSSVSPSKRYESIPRNFEIIAVDDSEDDTFGDETREIVAQPVVSHHEVEELHTMTNSIFAEMFDNVGGDDVLSIHTAYTDDIGSAMCLQPFETVEPEVDDSANERSPVTFDIDAEGEHLDDINYEEMTEQETVPPHRRVEDDLVLNDSEIFEDIYGANPSKGTPLKLDDKDADLETETKIVEVDTKLQESSLGTGLSSESKETVQNDNPVSKEESSLSNVQKNEFISDDPTDFVTSSDSRNAVLPSSPIAEKLYPRTPEPSAKTLPVISSPSRLSTVPGQPRIPMPIMADANVPDPTDSPTRLQEQPILDIPFVEIDAPLLQTPQVEELVSGSPTLPVASGLLLHSLNPLAALKKHADGLFTPGDFSTASTPAEVAPPSPKDSQPAELIDTHDLPQSIVSPEKATSDSLTEPDVGPSQMFASDERNVSIHVPQMSVLLAEPYPYSLSTPNLMQDNVLEDPDVSISSNATTEMENEVEPLEVEVEPHILSQSMTTEPQDTDLPCVEPDAEHQAIATSFCENTAVLPEMENTLDMMKLQYPSPPATSHEETPSDHSEMSCQVSKEQVMNPLDLKHVQTSVPVNPDVEEASLSVIVKELVTHYGLHLPRNEENPVPQDVASSPTRPPRQKSGTPDLVGSVAKDKHVMKRKREEDPFLREQAEHDTIHVRPSGSPYKDFASLLGASVQNQTTLLANDENRDSIKVEIGSLPAPQSLPHAPTLFHAHGKKKRQKLRIQRNADLERVDKVADPNIQSPIQQTSDNPPVQSKSVCTPQQVIQPTAVDSQNTVRRSPEPSQPNSKVAVQPEVAVTHEKTAPPLQPLISDETSQSVAAPVATPPMPSTPQTASSRPLAASMSTSSIRSTRSQCKYHKIKVPMEENGPRVCFLVPGCSLTNAELMREEEIEDLGEATYEDSLQITQDFQDLDFDQYLMGTLRQLVGLDILREGEVFYLSQPGVDVPRKRSPRKSTSERMPMKGIDPPGYASSPGYSYSGSMRSPSTRPPLSNANSVSMSSSAVLTSDNESDNENVDETSSPSKGKIKGHIRRISQIGEGSMDGDSTTTPASLRKSIKRGVKRTQTHDGPTKEDGTRKVKRLRLHLTDPTLHQARQD